jgi:hypothetical protein
VGHTIGRVCGLLASIVILAVGILGLVPIWPRWVWITLGVAGLLFILGQFIWGRRGAGAKPAAKVNQSQEGGVGSMNFQAGRDIKNVTGGDQRGGDAR